MKQLIIGEKTHRSLISALVDLEIFLIAEHESTDEVKILLATVRAAKDIETKK
jgi:hypothetical protein